MHALSDSDGVNLSSFSGGFNVADPGNTFTFDRALVGSGSLSKAGPGTLVLTSNASNCSGGATSGGDFHSAATPPWAPEP